MPSKSKQIKVERRAEFHDLQLRGVRRLHPGPQDIFDYGIGPLWKKGVDGAGTTIAVIEGWDDPKIAKQIVLIRRDLRASEPPDPERPFRLGDGKLPAKCPARDGGARRATDLAEAWQGELHAGRHLRAPDRPLRKYRHLSNPGGQRDHR